MTELLRCSRKNTCSGISVPARAVGWRLGLQPAEPTPGTSLASLRRTQAECCPRVSQAVGVASDRKSHSNWLQQNGEPAAHGTAHLGAALTPTGTQTLSLACSPPSGLAQTRSVALQPQERGAASPHGSRQRPGGCVLCPRPSQGSSASGCGHRPSLQPGNPSYEQGRGSFPKESRSTIPTGDLASWFSLPRSELVRPSCPLTRGTAYLPHGGRPCP